MVVNYRIEIARTPEGPRAWFADPATWTAAGVSGVRPWLESAGFVAASVPGRRGTKDEHLDVMARLKEGLGAYPLPAPGTGGFDVGRFLRELRETVPRSRMGGLMARLQGLAVVGGAVAAMGALVVVVGPGPVGPMRDDVMGRLGLVEPPRDVEPVRADPRVGPQGSAWSRGAGTFGSSVTHRGPVEAWTEVPEWFDDPSHAWSDAQLAQLAAADPSIFSTRQRARRAQILRYAPQLQQEVQRSFERAIDGAFGNH